ncbi:hypothetical protein Tco_1276623, partial [Tanacetum coccineum]
PLSSMYGLCSPWGKQSRLQRRLLAAAEAAARLLRRLSGYYEGCKTNVNAARLLRRLLGYCEGCQAVVKAARLL